MREVPGPAVVVGADGSKAALHAAVWAVDEAINRDIPLRLVYVIDPLHPVGAGGHDAGHDGPQAAACTALRDARQAAESTGEPVKVESEILWGKPLTTLMEESRYAAMVCIGSIGLNHACRGGGSVAAALATSALCPVAVINGGFLPDEHEVERARAIVAAFKASDGKGAVQLNGMMLDKPHLTQALQILAAAGENKSAR